MVAMRNLNFCFSCNPQAYEKCFQNLHYVERYEGHTIAHAIHMKYEKTKVHTKPTLFLFNFLSVVLGVCFNFVPFVLKLLLGIPLAGSNGKWDVSSKQNCGNSPAFGWFQECQIKGALLLMKNLCSCFYSVSEDSDVGFLSDHRFKKPA